MVRNPDLHLTISNPALFQLSERSYPGGRRPLCQTALTNQVIQEQASPPPSNHLELEVTRTTLLILVSVQWTDILQLASRLS